MFYIQVENGRPVQVSKEHPGCGSHWAHGYKSMNDCAGWLSNRDFQSLEDARTMATYLTAMQGKIYLAADEGEHTYPRYRVIEAPRVGDEVSRSFNGDSYPCGKIAKITPTWQVTTDQGVKFRRYKNTGGWRKVGGTWWMIAGFHEERNPHF